MKKSIFLFFAAILCAMSVSAKTIYLKPNSNWAGNSPRNAAYFFGNGEKWVGMTDANGDGIYECEAPDGYPNVIFCSMNKNTTGLGWSDKWNQTADLTLPTDGKNLCTLANGWDGVNGTWSTYTPPTLYIAGDFVTPQWSENAAANKMDYADGVYSKSYNDVAASAHQFKITNGTWTNAIGYDSNKCSGTNCTVENGGGNIKFTPLAEGTVTITYTLADGKVHITCPEPPAAEHNITYPTTQTNYTLVAGAAKAQAGAEVSFTATPADGYVLNVTYNGNAITGNNNVYTFMMPASDVTIAITAVAATTLYYVDHNSWGNANAYMWNDSGNNGWPGVAMTSVGTVGENNYAYYSVSFAQGAYTSIIFSNNGNNQTADQTIDPAKPYFYDGAWYTWDELLAKLAAPVVTYDYYICGSFNSNNPKNAENGMTLVGDVYKATVTLAEGDNTLKVTDGTWDKTWGANELGAAYEEVSNPNDYNNIKITLAAEAEKEITVIFDATAGKITFEGLTPYVAPLTYTVTVPAGTEKCYIAGPKNDWSFQEMTATANENEFTITITGAKETDEYKYACQADWAYAEVIEGGGNRTAWSALDEVTAWNKPVVYTYYLMGVNDDWATGIEMEVNTDAENEVMITCQPVNGEVKIKRLGDDASEYWYGGKSLKAEEGNLGTNTGTGDEDGNILLEEGIYNFYFNTADGKLWIAAATGCVIEPEYNVVEDYITNFVFDTEAWPMVCMGGPSTTYQVEVFLTLTEDADGTLAYEDCSVSIMGTDATFIDGTLSNIDPYAPYADAVLHVQWDGDYYELQLAMSSTPAEAITIEAEDATVTLTEYPTNFEETEFAYELSMVANWVNEAESLPYTVEFVIPTFDPTAASGEYIANFYVTGEGDAAGMNENVTVTVTKDGNNVTLTGNVSALNGNAYNVTISGTLPVAAPDYTRTVTPGYYGTICLPYGSSYMTGATFFETSHIEGDKVYFNEVTTLKAGHAYIFLARTDKIAIYKEGDETVVTPIAKNGLYGTFDPITDVAAESANDEYIIVYNNTTAQCELSMCGNNCSLEANRAYVVLSEIGTEPVQLMPGCRRIGMSVQGENEATGFENITAPAGKTIKAVVNSQLIIIRDGEMYNAQGVRL